MEALGMIETKGMIATIEALDSMLKAADVHLVNNVKVGAGLVTVLVEGDVGAVKAAVDAGAAAVRAINPKALKSEHVIPRPDASISIVLKRGGGKKAAKPDAPDPDPSPDNGGGAPEAEIEGSEVISADNRSASDVSEKADAVITESSAESAVEASDIVETEEAPENEEEAVISAEAESAETESIGESFETEDHNEVPESSAEETEPEAEAEPETEETEPEAEAEPETEETEPEAEAEPETVEAEPEAEAEPETEEAEPEAEAEPETVEAEPEAEAEPETVEAETVSEADESNAAELPQVTDRESIDKLVAAAGSDSLDQALEGLRVSELRKLARGYNGFSLTGRDISKANKKMLIEAFKEYYK